jgi:hypothetical protein
MNDLLNYGDVINDPHSDKVIWGPRQAFKILHISITITNETIW